MCATAHCYSTRDLQSTLFMNSVLRNLGVVACSIYLGRGRFIRHFGLLLRHDDLFFVDSCGIQFF